jgi:predicted lipoprotein with Yx(FWY)xxD motif
MDLRRSIGMSRIAVVAVAAAVCFGLAACGDDDEAAEPATTTEQAAPATTPAEGASARPGAEIKTASSEFGTILFDGDDRAIYLFEKEKSDTSECYGECAAAWPPVLTDGEPQAGSGAKGSLLGTTERRNATQVTYNGHPLYYYVDDPPKQVLCHDIVEFGGLWLVVKPNGDAVPPA